ncbi:MAG TPA: hypothetical protein VFQ15_01060 [Jiangellaceae bacterium]|nr:hypothetical protein [Jiangellaceae bacterium]
MISPDRARAVAELDTLTQGLWERAEQLARRLELVLRPMPDTVVVAGGLCTYHGPGREVLCASCMEPAGTCRLTGGIEPCDGATDLAALAVEAAAAPTIHTPIRTGGI